MNIYLENIKLSEQKAGGVTSYWYELVKRLIHSHKDTYLIEHKSASSINIYRPQLEIEQNKIINERHIPIKILRYLPISAKLKKESLLHSGYYRISLQRNIVNIVTVYDFIYEYHRKGLPRFVHSLQKEIAISKADGIICISHNTKNDLLKFYPSVDKNKIRVIYLGVSKDYYPIEKGKAIHDDLMGIIDKHFILFVGGRRGYKNFNIAVDVVQKMYDFILVIVGGEPLSAVEKISLNSKLNNRYHYLMGIDNNKLNILYNNAFCLIYPTTYEGFGIPILEAMRAGCPVVTTGSSSIPEVCGNAGLIADKIHIDEFIKKVRSLEDDVFRKKIINLGYEQSNKFSWDATFNETLNYYHEIYCKKLHCSL